MKQFFKTITGLCLAVLLMLSFGCCKNPTTEEDSSENALIAEYNSINKEGEFFYNIDTTSLNFWVKENHIVVQKERWEKEGLTSVVTYPFVFVDTLFFSIGDSYQGDSCIFINEGNSLRVMYQPEEKEEYIIPIAHDKEKAFFACERDISDTRVEYKILCLLSSGQVKEFPSFEMEAPPYMGICIKEEMYFTVYNYDSEDYSLYRWNMNDSAMKVKKIDSGLEKGQIFLDKDGKSIVCAHQGKYTFSTGKTYNAESVQLFQAGNKLFSFPNSPELKTEVYDLSKSNTIFQKRDVRGFAYKNGKMVLYGQDGERHEVRL